MKKITTLVLMLCLTLSGALCYASGAAGTEKVKGEGIPIEVKECTGSLSQPDKSSAIVANINGHYLTVSFTENLGRVDISVTTATGALVDCTSTPTPNGIQFYIPNAGDYVVTFTLTNGDEYYGEFTVTD